MLSVMFAFVGSLIYGGSDFLGGLAAQRMTSIRVTCVNAVVGVIALSAASFFIPAVWSTGAIVWGGLSGVAGALALILLYACLAIGPMSILSPIMGLISAALPVAVGLILGERLDSAGYAGIALGLIAIVLVCFVPGRATVRPSRRAILLAVGAGASVGVYLICIDLSPANSGPAPLTACFVVTGIVAGGILLAETITRRQLLPVPVAELPAPTGTPGTRGTPGTTGTPGAETEPESTSASVVDVASVATAPARKPRSGLGYAIGSGLTDAVAASLLLVALRLGELSIVSVIEALSPAGTIVLAAIVLKERLARVQWVGLAAVLVAAALLSFG